MSNSISWIEFSFGCDSYSAYEGYCCSVLGTRNTKL